MSRKITTLISFKIQCEFEEWAKIFDIKRADQRHPKFDIYQFLRGFSKVDPK